MPAIFAPIAVFLASILSALIARVLTALGLGVITYVGVSALVDRLNDTIAGAFGQVGEDIAFVVGRLGVDEAMTILLSAWVAVLTVNGLRNGAKRLVPYTGD